MGNTNVKPHPKPRNKKQVRWKAADRPSPPGKPSLIQENSYVPDVVHICWSKPEKDGGSTVTSYLVEHRRVGTSHWLKSSSVQITTNELVVNGLEPGWRYQFRVRAENAVGLSDPSEISEPYSATLQRSAIAAPKFTEELKDTVALEHGKVEFEVNFLGQPPPNLCWFKDGFEIFSGNRTRITQTSDRSVLTILQATAADEGEIKCTATNRAGHSSTKCKLTIEAPPAIKLPKSYQDPDGIIFEIGETIKMNVTVTGRPTPLIFWSHDGESIQNNDRYDIEYNDKIASVRIENALRSDRGEYRIKAVNKLGQDGASFLVTITDKPTPPGKARVLLTSGKSVTLCWSTPKDDGGCRVGNYIIEYYRLGWDVWLKAATTRQLSTMLGDLIEGSQYKFRVKAESPYGVSEPSEESEVVFIPDLKRGIQEPSDVKRDEVESKIPLAKRRRANSTPRVSFVLNEDVPIRPERKKTGKTPEASPRLKRRQISSFSKNVLGSEPSLNRSVFSYSGAQGQSTWNSAFTSNSPDITFGKKGPIMTQREIQKKSPSPEIIITDADVENGIDSKEMSSKSSANKSPPRSPNFFDRSSWKGTQHEKLQPENANHIPNSSRIDKQSDVQNLDQFRNTPNRQERFVSRGTTSPEKSPSRSPDHHKGSPLRSLNNSPTSSSSPSSPKKSPSRSPNFFEGYPPRSPENLETSSGLIRFNKKASPEKTEKSPSPNRKTKHIKIIEPNKKEGLELKIEDYTSTPKITEVQSVDKVQSKEIKDRMRPPLRQEFSGSSEFMLVLCPEDEQGTRFKRFSISFDENAIPPPLSLSAPELGIEPPELPSLRRSASSTELLTYHLMERLYEAAMNESNAESSKANTNIPTIRVNSESTEFNSIEDNTRFTRRMSGTIPNQSSWSNRRYSLKNAKEIDGNFATRLQRYEETDEMRREVQEYRKISEFEHEQEGTRGMRDLADEDEWLKEYEESIPSEEESDVSSPDERKLSLVTQPRNDINEDEEEIYNPRNRMMTAVKANNDQPFEILTVRKNPPKSNIVPKPILKKTSPSRTEEEPTDSRNTASTFMFQTLPPNTIGNERDPSVPTRNRSNSLSAAFEDELDVSQIKRSPTPNKRRSFSLIPSQATFIKEAFKSKNQKDSEEPKTKATKNVSALANFTSIAGAGFVIPNEMQEKKEIEEEAKVVVDFYGDIVKNFGSKSKPTAEFSRSITSKYDTFEERKISDIKPNADSLASQNVRPKSPNYSDFEKGRQEKAVDLTKIAQISTKASAPKQESNVSNFSQPEAIERSFQNKKPVNSYYNVSTTENIQPRKETNFDNRKTLTISNTDSSRERDESLRQMKAELSQSRLPERSSIRYQDKGAISNRYSLESRRTGRKGSRNSSVGRRKQTPMSRDASTSPVRFSDDWDSQCSSKTSLEQDYYNRGSLNSSRASSLSRRSLSPPRPKLRGITTQTSFRIESGSPADAQEKINLAKDAEKRMSFVFEYFTDLSMVAVAGWLFLFQSEYLAVPFILIPIYRQLEHKIKSFSEGVERKLPQWIRRRLKRNR
ncbi:uncharacterized protein LOC123673563 [Harmonia axyridis]|uniref:uncharacterized protein LOC123673563 n=1 Tax=Harmonia axyridis TaxID=115357 RepID=UPI001E276BD2|nr:uncharacterized protein LOC123673563 [Harmonia axyridis]